MKLNFGTGSLTVQREEGDPKYYGRKDGAGESKFLHAVKEKLNTEGYVLIKKRMWKDGHLVDDTQQYLRTRKKGKGKGDIFIYNHNWALYGADERFNEGSVTLTVVYDIFKK